MSKTKTAFFCQNCGTQSAKWIGKCPSCGEWNSFVEEVVSRDDKKPSGFSTKKKKSKPRLISDLQTDTKQRIPILDQELHRVLGGGLVPGSLILFGGEPGIGKSTLMLQVALRQLNLSVLYVSGEESEEQIRMRVERLGMDNPRCYVLMETELDTILVHLEDVQPNLVIIDSIQTLQSSDIDSAPGSISQVRDCTTRLMKFAKETHTPVFLIGHITKEGTLAGPKVLEHMVDTVLQFEGDRHHIYRLLRSTKNRFGSTNELGIYEMQGTGLREVANPSEILIHTQSEQLSGSAIAATMEGLRPLLIEIQALVSTAVYGTPQRNTTGFDIRRLNMLLAVLEKRSGFRLGMKDVFLNIAGGMRLEDPAMDLAVISAVLSSNEDIPVPANYCFAGEVGLSGEIRPVPRIDQRINEAMKLGMEKIFVSKHSKGLQEVGKGIQIVAVGKVEELFSELFG
ncbi:MAG: DNA repair protein RadA [Crocinitomicaceae bacterium]|nr:DNA repair protein RadA [Crocinitomicaceae bacterium]